MTEVFHSTHLFHSLELSYPYQFSLFSISAIQLTSFDSF